MANMSLTAEGMLKVEVVEVMEANFASHLHEEKSAMTYDVSVTGSLQKAGERDL